MDLVKFAKKCVDKLTGSGHGHDIDCYWLADLAVECGIMKSEVVTEHCGVFCACEDIHDDMSFGVTCYQSLPIAGLEDKVADASDVIIAPPGCGKIIGVVYFEDDGKEDYTTYD